MANGTAYQRVDPRGAPPLGSALVNMADVLAAHRHVAQDPFGVDPVGFSIADVEALGRYLQSLLVVPTAAVHPSWEALRRSAVEAFAVALHESTELNALVQQGVDPYDHPYRCAPQQFAAAHRQAVAAEARYWEQVAWQQGLVITAAALEMEHFRRRHTQQHVPETAEVLREQGWPLPTAAERQAARDFFAALNLTP